MAAAKLISLSLIMALVLFINASPSTAYTNYTVGGDAGWFFYSSTNKPSADYSAWTANKTFNLGDYLVFNTSTNQTVIQTYNKTTYDNCTLDYSSDNDTFQFSSGSDEFDIATIIYVPLTLEGVNYYFSDANDGDQCLQGMAFEIKVNQGLGLPPSLNQPPPPPYVPPAAPAADQFPPATTNTPTNGGTKRSFKSYGFASMILVLFSFLQLSTDSNTIFFV